MHFSNVVVGFYNEFKVFYLHHFYFSESHSAYLLSVCILLLTHVGILYVLLAGNMYILACYYLSLMTVLAYIVKTNLHYWAWNRN